MACGAGSVEGWSLGLKSTAGVAPEPLEAPPGPNASTTCWRCSGRFSPYSTMGFRSPFFPVPLPVAFLSFCLWSASAHKSSCGGCLWEWTSPWRNPKFVDPLRPSPVYQLLLQQLPRALLARRSFPRALLLLQPLTFGLCRPVGPYNGPWSHQLLSSSEIRSFGSNPCLEPLSLPCKTIYSQTWALQGLRIKKRYYWYKKNSKRIKKNIIGIKKQKPIPSSTPVCINVWMYACTHVCMYVCIVYVCMYVFNGCVQVYVWRQKTSRHQQKDRRLRM